MAGVEGADAVGGGVLSGGALAEESLEEGTRVQRSFSCDGGRGTHCGPGLRQRPHFPGRQLEQGLNALTQAYLLHVPDLLQRQQVLPRDPEVGGGGGGGGGGVGLWRRRKRRHFEFYYAIYVRTARKKI